MTTIDIQAATLQDIASALPGVQADLMGIDPEHGRWLAARDGATLVGVARITETRDGATLDDVWVFPEHRKRGVATQILRHAAGLYEELWLICDEDMVAFYAARGFVAVPKPELPEALAALYSARGEWPRASDHDHVAMRTRSRSAAEIPV